MEYSYLVQYYEKLEKTSSKIKKTEILAELFRNCSAEILSKIVLLIEGRVFAKFEQLELGFATQMMIKAISKATGFSQQEIIDIFKEMGDLGLTAEKCVERKRQRTLFKKELSVELVFDQLKKIAYLSGEGSQERKISIVAELINSSKPKEARYLVRTILEDLRVGVAEGLIRDAIALAFLIKGNESKEEKENILKAVDYAWNILSDFSEVAKIAKEEGVEGLKNAKVKIGKPIQVMLGLASNSIEEVVKEFGKVAAEIKYDGMRAQIHKKGNDVWVFTRRLENVTFQFPDVVDLCRKCLNANECIVEGEVLGIDTSTGKPVPFQKLGQRIHRKYEIEEMVKEIPVQVNLFDIVYLNGEPLFSKPFYERRKILEEIVLKIENKFQLAKQIVTDDIQVLERFYHEALNQGQEGLFLKVLDSPYIFGRHVGGWYKIKPIMETLDLVIIGATWGEGKRAKWLTSYLLAVRDPETGKFLSCGMMSTGLSEDEYETMTRMLEPLIISSEGRDVKVKPKIVLEVGYQEIQKSPHYESGYALRFPRFIRIRDDKSEEEADDLNRLENLFKSQGRKG